MLIHDVKYQKNTLNNAITTNSYTPQMVETANLAWAYFNGCVQFYFSEVSAYVKEVDQKHMM